MSSSSHKNKTKEKNELTWPFLVLLGCLFIFFALVITLTVLLVVTYKENDDLNRILSPYKSDIQVDMTETNQLFVESKDVDFIAIGLKKRKKSHFDLLENDLKKEGISVNFFEGINGKELKLKDQNLAPRYLHFFENNIKDREAGKTDVDYRGHLGCTLSHLKVIENIQGLTVILEDDADIVPNFRKQFQQTLADVTRHDPKWEVLILGCSAKYDDHSYHKMNDLEPIYPGGIVKLHYWIGGWAYVIRNKKIATKILTFFNPINWHIDLTIAEQARQGNLNVYGRMPPIVNHPGYLRISSFDLYQYGDPSKIKTDTNH
jgi:GR25 family glycosyltransferase involved in LPS biosynthesis